MSRRVARGPPGGGRRCVSFTGALVAFSTVLAGASIYSVLSASSLFLRREGLRDVLKTTSDHAPTAPSLLIQATLSPKLENAPLERRVRDAEPRVRVPVSAPVDWGAISPKQPPQESVVQGPESREPSPVAVAPPLEAAPLLIIGIPTVGRAGDAAYLIRTLCYIEAQVRDGEWLASYCLSSLSPPSFRSGCASTQRVMLVSTPQCFPMARVPRTTLWTSAWL